jgi:type I restriction enzyme S subunit
MVSENLEFAVGSLATFINGDRSKNYPSQADRAAVGIPFVNAADLVNGSVCFNSAERITRPAFDRLSSGKTNVGDILFCLRGTPGRVARNTSGLAAIASSLVILRPNPNVDARYLFYLLSSPAFQADCAALNNGSAQPNVSASALRGLVVTISPLNKQRAIAHILGTLDDKIELNRRANETLEAMARALFKAWFVDFEPVRAKMEGRWQRGQSLPGLPAHLYDLFPDRLVDSELGEIPEGWRVFAFSDVAQQGKGSVNPGNAPEDAFTHYSLPAFDAGQTPVIELGAAIKSNKTPVPDGAVLVSKLNPHIPRIWQVGEAGANAVCSTEFIVWTPKAPANSAFLYCLACSSEFNSAMQQLVTGTSNSHQRVKPDQLSDIRVFAARESAIGECSKIFMALIEPVLQNRQQSRALSALRDALLPKLISGELRVQDAEKFVERAS